MKRWNVTLLDRGLEVTIEVWAGSKQVARNEAHRWHPLGHIVHVEMVPGSTVADDAYYEHDADGN